MRSTLPENIIYWLATLAMFGLMFLSISMYFTRHDVAAGFFVALGYPAYIVYPLAVLKLIALLVILTNRYDNLKHVAYGAYFLNMIVATYAHVLVGDNPVHAYVGLLAVPVSYLLSNRVRGKPARNAFILPERDPS